MGTKESIKKLLRPFRDVINVFIGFLYDLMRFYLYSGWYPDYKDEVKRNYKAVKIYHSLEKSLSYRYRREGAGWNTAEDLIKLLDNAIRYKNVGYQDKIAANVLDEFYHLDTSQSADINSEKIKSLLAEYEQFRVSGGGTVTLTPEYFKKHALNDPEHFFLSRYTVRDFSKQKVDSKIIERAIHLSMKAPSVCNRQAWHVYNIMDEVKIVEALEFQGGCTGFEKEVPCLLLITIDLKAFDSAGERYQHWIDGGILSMSLVMAFHSLGLSSCCLNWSRTAQADLKFRKIININPAHTIMMMLAVGYPKDEIKVCASERRPLNEVYTEI